MAENKKFVYFFGKSEEGKNLTEGKKEFKSFLGGKGANLAEMANIGVRVPPGFTISAEVCQIFDGVKIPSQVETEILANLEKLEKLMKKKLGDPEQLLLVSVRSGAAISMPGMMDTVLNLGLNDKAVETLAKKSGNPKWAWDSYRRLMQMFGDVCLGIAHSKFDKVLTSEKAAAKVKLDKDLTVESLKKIVQGYHSLYKQETGKGFPQTAIDQLKIAIIAVFQSWNNERAIAYRKMNKIKGLIGTAVNVQTMVFGNLNAQSGTGVCFSRSPSTGESIFYGEFLENAQGEDVVAGIRTPKTIDQMKNTFPKAYDELIAIYKKLEKHYCDMQDMEFTIEDGILYMLQTRNGKRTAAAAVRIAVEMVEEGLIDKKTAILRITPQHLENLLHRSIDNAYLKKNKIKSLAKGLNASPGAAAGHICFNNEQAVELKKNGKPVVLVRNETSPEDLIGMDAANGILTAHGGRTSHAAVVARTMGKTCVAGCGEAKIDEENGTLIVGGKTFNKGDLITLDGTEGLVYGGSLPTKDPEFGTHFKKLMTWEKTFRKVGVRTNADSPKDTLKAIEFGAEGVGLCRTEHMFFEKTRIKFMRQMILANDKKSRVEAVQKLKPFQKSDFYGMFKALNGLPITIRLLDPPLHEFLPHEKEEQQELAKEMGISMEEMVKTVDSLCESNPMLGHRGCRLGITYPEITQMQAEAIFEAAKECHEKEKMEVVPEVMVPLIGSVLEFVNQKKIIVECAERILKGTGIKYKVGTMIETPRAAIVAGKVAEHAEFFSFGTNDLTQMTFGFSRDDAGKFISEYKDLDILEVSPFEELDRDGVGYLVKKATLDGRKTNPKLKVGICGEHGGNPHSVEFVCSIPLNYSSCSPYRVPIARLAACQAEIKKQN